MDKIIDIMPRIRARATTAETCRGPGPMRASDGRTYRCVWPPHRMFPTWQRDDGTLVDTPPADVLAALDAWLDARIASAGLAR